MKTRTVTNIGQPYVDATNKPISGLKVSFVIVNEKGRPTEVLDLDSGNPVSGDAVFVRTDENGEFSINLYPNELGDRPTWYLVRVHDPDFEDFKAVLPDGNSPISLIDFKLLTNPVDPSTEVLAESYFSRLLDDTSESLNKVWSSTKIMLLFTNLTQQTQSITFIQELASDYWLITHNLGRPVHVITYDEEGDEVVGAVTKLDNDTIEIQFSEEVSGEAFLR